MKLISCASYYGSGSSAVTDLLSEYSSITSLGSNFECRIAHDMFGLSDLEYYLVDNYHRHNSSTAISKFKRLTGIYGLNPRIRLENYPGVFGKSFEVEVDKYLKALIAGEYAGGSHADLYELSDYEIILLKIKNRIYRKLHHNNYTVEDSSYENHAVAPLEKARKEQRSYISYPRDSFLKATKRFTSALFDSLDVNSEYLLVDQLVPPTNTMRYVRYFENLSVICVDRDPRDIYYLEKKFWKGGIVPEEPHAFVSWYKATREHLKYENDDPKRVLRIRFEDLVLQYDVTVRLIESFLGLDPRDHFRPKNSFNPDISVRNIGKWKNDEFEINNIKIIEKALMLS